MPDGVEKMNTIPDIAGATEVVSWFGRWPSFHDAEIISLNLNRSGSSTLVVHAWNMTEKVDASCHFVLEKHAVVTFSLSEISGLDLCGFSCQNVIGDLTIERLEKGFRITLIPCYGISGSLDAEIISVSVQPGKPEGDNNSVRLSPA